MEDEDRRFDASMRPDPEEESGFRKRFFDLVRREREMFRDRFRSGSIYPDYIVGPGKISVRVGEEYEGKLKVFVRNGTARRYLFYLGQDFPDLVGCWLVQVAKRLWECDSLEEMELLLEARGY